MSSNHDYISIPLNLSEKAPMTVGKEKGGVQQSIDAVLDLIVFTPKGSFPADPEFGFEYWNHEFSNINVREFNNSYVGLMYGAPSLNEVSKKQCEESLHDSIAAYEPRLINPEVKIELELNEKIRRKKNQSKYEMRIMISGAIDDGLGVVKNYEKRIVFLVEPTAKKISI